MKKRSHEEIQQGDWPFAFLLNGELQRRLPRRNVSPPGAAEVRSPPLLDIRRAHALLLLDRLRGGQIHLSDTSRRQGGCRPIGRSPHRPGLRDVAGCGYSHPLMNEILETNGKEYSYEHTNRQVSKSTNCQTGLHTCARLPSELSSTSRNSRPTIHRARRNYRKRESAESSARSTPAQAEAPTLSVCCKYSVGVLRTQRCESVESLPCRYRTAISAANTS